jgi:DNA-binding GntR family transcriptional regulator
MTTLEFPFEIDRQSITDRVYHHIKKMILSGHLKGGDKVPEEKVAQQLKVSRTPIREAIRKLEQYGLIRIKPRSYAVVVELKKEEIFDISIIRFYLEKLVLRLLCEYATADDIAHLKAIALECSRLFREGYQAEAFESDSRFHLEAARRTGNMHLYEILEHLDAKVQLMRLRHGPGSRELAVFMQEHEQISAFLAEKNLDGINTILEHHIMNNLR